MFFMRKSNAPVPVERMPRFVMAVCVPPAIVGALMTGVPIVGDVPKTSEPLPVSSEIVLANSKDDVDANWLSLPSW